VEQFAAFGLTLLLTGKSSGDGSYDDLGSTHDKTTDEEDGSTTHLVDSQDSRERHGDVDGGENDNVDEHVIDLSVLSKDGTVTEVKVDSGKLLTGLDETSDHGPPCDSVLGAEDLGVRSLSQLGLLLLGDPHLLELVRNLLVLGGQVTELGEVDPGLVPIASSGKVRGRFGRKDETDEEQTGPNEGESDGEPPGDVTGVLGHSVGATVDQEDTVDVEPAVSNPARRRPRIQAATYPRVTLSWKDPVINPRRAGGLASAWKTGTKPEVAPTPAPAKKRPTQI